MTQKSLLNVAQLPLPGQIGSQRPEFELPMLLLAMIRSDHWHEKGPGYLVLTDLTSNPNTTVAAGKLPAGVPLHFRLKDDMADGLLEADEIFTVNVLYTKFPRVVSLLQQHSPDIIGKYNFTDSTRCNIANEGLVVLVKFTLKVYSGCIEATFAGLRTVDHTNASSLFAEGDPRLQELLNRFDARSYKGVVDKLKQNLGLDPTSLRRQIKAEKALLLPDRRPQLHGRALMFQQHESDDESSSDGSLHYPLYTQVQPLQPLQPLQVALEASLLSLIAPPLHKHSLSTDEPPPKRQLTPSVAVRATQASYENGACNLAMLPPLPATMIELRRKLMFRVDVTILGLYPRGPFVLKPFNRTLKVAPLKLIVRDNTRELELEFNTPKEICDLVGCTEEEELYDLQFLALEKLNRLSGCIRTFTFTAAYMKHKTGFFRLYWTGKMVHRD